MPTGSHDGYLFLSPIQHPKSVVWFKQKINLGESTLRHFVREMASAAGLIGDYTNKSGRVTTITRMCIREVPPDAIASNTGHKNFASIQRYDRSKALKTRAAQTLARPTFGEARNFHQQYEIEVANWNEANSTSRSQTSFLVSDIMNGTDHNKQLGMELNNNTSSEPSSNTISVSLPSCSNQVPSSSTLPQVLQERRPIEGVSKFSRPFFQSNSGGDSDPLLSMSFTQSASASLVEEEMRFWSQFNFEASDNNNNVASIVGEAPRGTRFAMQKSLALLRRENAVLKQQLYEASQQQISFQQQLDSLRRQQEELTKFHSASHKSQPFVNHRQSQNDQRPPVMEERFKYLYPGISSGGLHNRPYEKQFPNQVPPPDMQRVFSNRQAPLGNLQPTFSFASPQSLNFDPNGSHLVPGRLTAAPVPQQIAPVFGSTIYNYQNFDISRFLGNA